MPNRLIDETSPYLLQHARNPVDWYPWGEEAFNRSEREGKPIFLSIGYAACHWCHVMERESFENEDIAKLLNTSFVCIKVDREERPDVDSVYMDAVQAMTGHGGWPLSVFLTPDGKPFFGGTYYPPEERPGMPGFPRVLEAVLEAYRSRRTEVVQMSNQVVEQLRRASGARSQEGGLLGPDILQQALSRLTSSFDPRNGGFSSAPKFPQPMLIEFLLRSHKATGDAEALRMAEISLERMAQGGVYDHLGGGFHRYSTDAQWLIPHFEKMLYDNALLARVYLHAYQATRRADFRRVAEETLDFLLREMRDPDGGFYSSLDADSEGEEGKYYVWTPQEVALALEPEDGNVLSQAYGVVAEGNFEGGRSVLRRVLSPEDLAAARGLTIEESEESLAALRERLRAARSRRVAPGRDEKVLTAWNGLLLGTLGEASAVLGRGDYGEAARKLADFLLSTMRRQDGRLLRSYKDGQSRVAGYLEDYSSLAAGLLALYESAFQRRWLDEARNLLDAAKELFWSPLENTLYDTGKDGEALVVRPRNVLDNALPCGSSTATASLLHLAALTGEEEYRTMAGAALRGVRDYLIQYPGAMGHWLCALDFYLSTPREIALIGSLEDTRMRELLAVIHERYMPNKILVAARPEELGEMEDLPIMDGRTMVNGLPTAFVCENFVCKLPVNRPEALASQLDA